MRSDWLLATVLSLPLLSLAVTVHTLPQCLQTCIKDSIPQCSDLKCICPATTAPLLSTISACYHASCDATHSTPVSLVLADLAPLCFSADVPLRQAVINSALELASTTTYASQPYPTDGKSALWQPTSSSTAAGNILLAEGGPSSTLSTPFLTGAPSVAATAGGLPGVTASATPTSGAGRMRESLGGGIMIMRGLVVVGGLRLGMR